MTNAAIYARLSKDPDGRSESISTQLEDARNLAKARGWTVAGEYVETISAAKEDARTEWARMIEDVQAGKLQVIIGRAIDRMTRNRRDRLELLEVGEKHELLLAFTRGSDIDLATTSGQLVADILGSVARNEIKESAARIQRSNLNRARQGRFFGTRRPFGYEPGGVVIREPEAQAIRDAFELILNGGTLREVARRWNEAKLFPPQGKNHPKAIRKKLQLGEISRDQLPPRGSTTWTGPTVSRTLRTARLAGYRTYHGEIVRDDDGEPIRAEWPPIIDPDTWHAAQAVLNDPGRKSLYGSVFPSRLLLSGVARCADCDQPIQSGGKRKGKGVYRARYRCAAKAGHVYREAEPVNEFVEALVLGRLARPDVADLLAEPATGPDVSQLRRESSELHARMDGLAEAFADGEISKSALTKGTERARARLAEIEAQMPTDTQSVVLSKLITAQDPRQVWEALSLDARRGVIDALLSVRLRSPKTLQVRPYVYEDGERKINPETVEVGWRS